ncbi:hypothetical protein B0H67DRAFT_569104 [Lasiosphaeris hirsuta]|uniref:Uncharacterized protein n=1 Tax=Lasiosphaeris hirsuta TaxID=260670 RepID=A0AA40AZK3_9PEZI|nr:hypothetical protein B0H67DRAFT_569104 [Lasiosphaeris hirsuta]
MLPQGLVAWLPSLCHQTPAHGVTQPIITTLTSPDSPSPDSQRSELPRVTVLARWHGEYPIHSILTILDTRSSFSNEANLAWSTSH